jgi:hypothetical protein
MRTSPPAFADAVKEFYCSDKFRKLIHVKETLYVKVVGLNLRN